MSPALGTALDKLGAYVATFDAHAQGYVMDRFALNSALAELDDVVGALPADDYDLYRAHRDLVWRSNTARAQLVRDRAVWI
jgi:hypothetical protein